MLLKSAMAFITVRIQTIDVNVHTSKDLNAPEITSGVTGNFVCGGRFNKFS